MLTAMLSAFYTASAYDFEVSGVYYEIIDFDNNICAVVANPNGYSNALYIPDSVELNGHFFSVAELSKDAFSGCNDLQSISINGIIEAIPYGIFDDCKSLSDIELRNGATAIEIEGYTHGGLWGHQACNIYEGGFVDLPIKTFRIDREIKCDEFFNPFIRHHYWTAFNGEADECSFAEEVIFGNNIEKIPNALFRGCKYLRKIGIGRNIMKIEANSFENCPIEEIYINSLFQWGNIDFYDTPQNGATLFVGGEKLTSLIIDTYSNIKSKAFYGVNGLTQITVDAPNINIGDSAFYGIHDLESINFNDHDVKLGEGCFSDCTSLKEVCGLQNTASLPNFCFANCSKLSQIESNSVTHIGNDCFRDCKILQSVKLDNVVSIGERAFYNCTSLSDVELSKCHSIGTSAFSSCTSLESIMLNAMTIENYVFNNCVNLKYVELPQIQKLGNHVFENCSELESIKLGLYIETIPESTFNGCENILYISINAPFPPTFDGNFPNSTYINGALSVLNVSIDKYSETTPWSRFFNIKGELSDTTAIDGLHYLMYGDNAILLPSDAGYVGKVEIPYSIKFQNKQYVVSGFIPSVFKGCSDLTELVIPESFGQLPSLVDCKNLSFFTIQNAAVDLPEDYFLNFTKLEYVELGNSIISIGNQTFKNCSGLTSIKIPGSCLAIGNDAFDGCSSLKDVIFESSDEPIPIGYNTKGHKSDLILFPNPTTVDEARTAFHNIYYDGLFYNLPIEHLVINRNIELPKYYERIVGASTPKYSPVYDDITYFPPFYGLSKLKSVEIGENVTAICKNTIDVVLSAIPTTLPYTNFDLCNNIEVIISKNPNALVGGGFTQTVYENAYLFLPNGGESSYKADEYWKLFANIHSSAFIAIESLQIESDEIVLDHNESKVLCVAINPSDASVQKLRWSSSNSSVVSVDTVGNVTSYSRDGEAIITATTTDGTSLSVSCIVKVEKGTGIDNAVYELSPVSIDAKDGMITIKGKHPQDLVSIYNSQGGLVEATTADTITLLQHGIFIVRIGNYTQKIVL